MMVVVVCGEIGFPPGVQYLPIQPLFPASLTRTTTSTTDVGTTLRDTSHFLSVPRIPFLSFSTNPPAHSQLLYFAKCKS